MSTYFYAHLVLPSGIWARWWKEVSVMTPGRWSTKFRVDFFWCCSLSEYSHPPTVCPWKSEAAGSVAPSWILPLTFPWCLWQGCWVQLQEQRPHQGLTKICISTSSGLATSLEEKELNLHLLWPTCFIMFSLSIEKNNSCGEKNRSKEGKFSDCKLSFQAGIRAESTEEIWESGQHLFDSKELLGIITSGVKSQGIDRGSMLICFWKGPLKSCAANTWACSQRD